MQTTDVLVVGGGQDGIAMSEHLSRKGIDYIILKKTVLQKVISNRELIFHSKYQKS